MNRGSSLCHARFLTGVVAAALLAPLGIVAPHSAEAATSITGPSVPKPAAGSLEAAVAQAAATGDRVVVPDYITESTRLIANPDTTMTMEVSNEPVRVKQSGAWVDVNTALAPRADGRVAPRASAVDVSFSGGGSGAMVTYRSGRATLTLGPPVATLPAPVLTKNRARYNEILPGVDLVLSATADTFRQTVVIKSAAAAADTRVKSLKFASSLANATLTPTASGGFAAVEATTGIKAFESPQAIMWDSTTSTDLSSPSPSPTGGGTFEPQAEIQPPDGAQVTTVPVTATSTDLTLAPNPAAFTAQATYPIYVDPSFSPSRTGWAMVSSKYPTTKYWRFGGDEGMGYYNGSQGLMRKRLFYMFATGALVGSTIKRAKFTAFETHAYSCTASQVEVRRANDISPNTTWNNQPAASGTAESIRNVAYGRSDCSPGGHNVEFDVTKSVAYTVARRLPNTTLRLGATNESSSSGWKRFTGGAMLSIDYNHAPTTPYGVSMINPGKGCGGAFPATDPPDLRVVAGDADHENVAVTFTVRLGATVVWSTSVTVRYGTWAVVAIPKNADGTFLRGANTYTWTAVGRDGWGDVSPTTAACTFILDNPAVGDPSVGWTLGGAPLPPEVPAGATTAVAMGPGTGTNIVSYAWSVNSAALDRTWAPGQTTPTVTLSGAGTTTLYSQSISRAGTKSRIVSQQVQVVPATIQERDRWRFNEATTATSAADLPLPSAVGATAPLTLTGTGAKFTGGGNGASAKDDLRSGSLACSPGANVASTAQALVDPNKDWTLSAWVRVGVVPTGQQTLISEDGVTRPVFSLTTKMLSDWDPLESMTVTRPVFSLAMDNNTETTFIDFPHLTIAAGTWYKVAVTFEAAAKTHRVYIGEAGFPMVPASGIGLSYRPTVGKTLRLCSSFSGELDNVVNIPMLLSEEQINARLEQGQ